MFQGVVILFLFLVFCCYLPMFSVFHHRSERPCPAPAIMLAVAGSLTGHIDRASETQAEDALGNPLIRVPRHAYAFGLDITPTERFRINATAQVIRDTLDAGNFVLDDYVLLNAKASYDIDERLTAYIRGVNLLDQEYQVIRGYGTSDLAVYAGLRLKLDAPLPAAEPDTTWK